MASGMTSMMLALSAAHTAYRPGASYMVMAEPQLLTLGATSQQAERLRPAPGESAPPASKPAIGDRRVIGNHKST